MSHFLTLVLVEASETEPAGRAYKLMSPYFDAEDHSLQPPYKFDSCVIGGRFDGLITGKAQLYNLTPDA